MTTLDILYDGCREYAIKVKGYQSWATFSEIELWEQWKEVVFDTLEKNRRAAKKEKK